MTKKLIVAACLLCAVGGTVAAARKDPAVLTVGPDLAVAGTVAGKPARLQLLPNGSSTLIMNPDAAARFGLRAGWIGARVKVGPVSVSGNTAVVPYGVNGPASKRRIGWFERPFAPGFDGAVGPTAASQPIVTFQLRAPADGERAWTLPLVDQGYAGAGTAVMIGKQRIFVRFVLTRGYNGSTAAAGAAIAAAYDGQFIGKSWKEPLAFGVERPVRRLQLAKPMTIGPIRFDSLAARTSDYGSTSTIPDADADANEIVVTGRRGGGKAIYAMEIGRDSLKDCSSLTFDKPRKHVILRCS